MPPLPVILSPHGRIPVCYKVMYGVGHLVRDDRMIPGEAVRFSVLSEYVGL